ncbi:Na(+)/H(+) antiporter subunit C [Gordonia sp. (in: high G+C Gram-positive bacteria)]|uniref:Na(+)/H(+) antiporter subunit C n=1 Tax=Gordonia sp. (in: high G+C Gram-positive bacteria) TaxID=84139 RepID=UPI001D44B201|nr:Na(+)/H(+) antiporter subunit C [Gordonia sp. (in: high G+C Gram-positive bacteria)]MCB1296599.1 Na(+)/H(+) antiporter subunit C [Gordonia sp. (in: high G+C Gram-positive bacteria)]HMS74445.1 Na(+)/H(+) antiporter subunit C [Gordonia sp. (in: high G+C Gram-positive bacteria)]HQV17741.1 Na(+)/H(+) antiporter subunit C [Gordonia sp. (in: high G+C Gram-positive bacteria)]
MSINLGLLIVVGVLAACGAYLLTERSLVRMLLGLLLCGNAINLMIVVVSGGPGDPPIKGRTSTGQGGDADPLAQAMVLTSIVITMGVAAFVLAMVYRLFVLNRDDDEVSDDTEDVKIVKGSLSDAPDRDRTDDPVTLADTAAGDLYDDDGNPLTPEEFEALHQDQIETDLIPASSGDFRDEMSDEDPRRTGSESAGEVPGRDNPAGGAS